MDHSTKNWFIIFDDKRTWVKRDIYFYSKNINDHHTTTTTTLITLQERAYERHK